MLRPVQRSSQVSRSTPAVSGRVISSSRSGVGWITLTMRSPAGAAAALVPEDPNAAMAALGGAVRDRSDARVVAITGSTGKTSTKDILAALCRPHRRTVAAEQSHNNEIGLPLTLTRIEPDTQIVIAEMGTRGPGQVAELCAIAQARDRRHHDDRACTPRVVRHDRGGCLRRRLRSSPRSHRVESSSSLQTSRC